MQDTAARSNWVFSVALLMLMWGLVGLQRNASSFLGPHIAAEFGLNLGGVGSIALAFAVAWGIGSLLAGRLADRHGTKPMLLIFGAITAVLGWISGLAATIAIFIAIRTALGLAEGGVLSPIMNAARRTAPPAARARVVSLMFIAFIILGMVVAPPLLDGIANSYGWRTGFFIAAGPMAVVVLLLLFFFREPALEQGAAGAREGSNAGALEDGGEGANGGAGASAHADGVRAPLLTILRTKNVWLSALMSICSMGRVFTFMVFGLFLLGSDVNNGGYFMLEGPVIPLTVSIALLADGLGGFAFTWIADRTGHRRKVVMYAFLGAMVFGLIFARLPAEVPYAILLISIVGFMFCGGAVSPLAVGVIPAEAVNPRDAVTATGTANAIGEILGAGMTTYVVGAIAVTAGLHATMMVPVSLMLAGAVLAWALDDVRANRAAPG